MNQSVTTTKTNEPLTNSQTYGFSQEVYEVVRDSIAKDATHAEMAFFALQCKRTGLDPVKRHIYFIKDKKGRVQIMTSIDGLRLIAQRSKDYDGQTQAFWCGEDGVWKEIWPNKKVPPVACKIGVKRKDWSEPLYVVAHFHEYAQTHAYDDTYNRPPRHKAGDLTHMWAEKGNLMIAKVAESLALRKAFPNELSGLYSEDEMAQAIPQAAPQPQQPQKQMREPVALPAEFANTNRAAQNSREGISQSNQTRESFNSKSSDQETATGTVGNTTSNINSREVIPQNQGAPANTNQQNTAAYLSTTEVTNAPSPITAKPVNTETPTTIQPTGLTKKKEKRLSPVERIENLQAEAASHAVDTEWYPPEEQNPIPSLIPNVLAFPGTFIVNFGTKFLGKSLSEMSVTEIANIAIHLTGQPNLTQDQVDFIANAEKYLGGITK